MPKALYYLLNPIQMFPITPCTVGSISKFTTLAEDFCSTRAYTSTNNPRFLEPMWPYQYLEPQGYAICQNSRSPKHQSHFQPQKLHQKNTSEPEDLLITRITDHLVQNNNNNNKKKSMKNFDQESRKMSLCFTKIVICIIIHKNIKQTREGYLRCIHLNKLRCYSPDFHCMIGDRDIFA